MTGPGLSPGSSPRGLVFRLAQADLVHEWVLSLCLVLAVAAILGPLLLLFGLKHGTMATLRQRLIADPRNREIRPLASRSFDREWLAELAARREVAFLVPATRQIAASVRVRLEGGARGETLDLIPTAPGDPLLLDNGAPIPTQGECVLSAAAARDLGAAKGRTAVVEVRRLKGSGFETGRMKLKVAGILDPRAGELKTVFVGLEVVEAVERYKDGLAVPDYGWAGSTPVAQPRYSGLVVILDKGLDKELDRAAQVKLISNTGFTRIEALDREELTARAGYGIGPGRAVFLLSSRRTVGEESIRAVELRLRGREAALIPWVKGLTGELIGSPGEPPAGLNLHALSIRGEDPAGLGLEPAPVWDRSEDQGPFPIILPADLLRPGRELRLRIREEERELEVPVKAADGSAPEGMAFIPARLAGVLNLFRTRELDYQPGSGRFILGRRGYAGFRLYAARIEDVDRLRRELEAQGLPVHTRAERIRDVLELDAYLTLIFWLVAAVGVGGGSASLVASLYASVQRKKRDLGVLRLLGLDRERLFRLPVYQGLIIAGGGFVLALVFFQALAWLINALFQAHLGAGESLCRLSGLHLLAALAGTLVLALAASLAAAWRTTRIDPSEALRDE